MRKIFILSVILTLLVASCDNTGTSQVIYDDTISDTLTMNTILEDTTKVLMAAMPVHFDSTEVLVHPIGWVDIYAIYKKPYSIDMAESVERGSISKTTKMKDSNYSFSVYSNNQDYISGQMVNLIFEDVATGEKRKLTDKVMMIYSMSYLKNVWRNTGKQYALYSVVDKDYNRDGKLDGLDMSSYYMSNLDGTNFTKITEDYHYFDTDQLILKNNKYYFRTLEDVNKDGVFNKKDKYHYYYIDLSQGDFKAIEYFPLEFIAAE